MKPMLRIFVFVALLSAVCLMTTPASAQLAYGSCDGCDSYGPRWFGFFERPYASGRIPTPPYFAIHPPVYYSYAVPRSYGYSPHAYPGTVRTPEIVEAPANQPAVIINPHVTPKVQETSAGDTSDEKVAAGQPRSELVLNPYYENPELKAGVELARFSSQ